MTPKAKQKPKVEVTPKVEVRVNATETFSSEAEPEDQPEDQPEVCKQLFAL